MAEEPNRRRRVLSVLGLVAFLGAVAVATANNRALAAWALFSLLAQIRLTSNWWTSRKQGVLFRPGNGEKYKATRFWFHLNSLLLVWVSLCSVVAVLAAFAPLGPRRPPTVRGLLITTALCLFPAIALAIGELVKSYVSEMKEAFDRRARSDLTDQIQRLSVQLGGLVATGSRIEELAEGAKLEAQVVKDDLEASHARAEAVESDEAGAAADAASKPPPD